MLATFAHAVVKEAQPGLGRAVALPTVHDKTSVDAMGYTPKGHCSNGQLERERSFLVQTRGLKKAVRVPKRLADVRPSIDPWVSFLPLGVRGTTGTGPF